MQDFLSIADWIGTFAFAVSGIILSIRKNLDIMGTYIVAILTSSGGGLLRDVLLNIKPSLLYAHHTFFIIFLLTILFKALRAKKYIHNLEGSHIFRFCDTLGLVAFAVLGAQKALSYELGFFPTLTMALLSSVGGGLIRDAMLGQINSTLTSGFYGSVSIIMGILVYLAHQFKLPMSISLSCIFVLGVCIRLIAIKTNFNLLKI